MLRRCCRLGLDGKIVKVSDATLYKVALIGLDINVIIRVRSFCWYWWVTAYNDRLLRMIC